MRFDRLAVFALVCLVSLLPLQRASNAQTWPNGTITIVSQLAAGGAADLLARAIGDEMSANIGKPVILESRAGGAGTIAAQYFARSRPDGSTILLATTFLNIAALKPGSPDPVQDLTPIMIAAEIR